MWVGWRNYGDGVSEQRESDTDSNVLPFPMHRVEAPESEQDSPPLRDVIGDVLRTERQRQDRTLADVADEAAVSLPYLSEVERGRKEVSSDLLDAIIDSLGLDLAEVLERAADQLRIGRDRRGPQAQLLAA